MKKNFGKNMFRLLLSALLLFGLLPNTVLAANANRFVLVVETDEGLVVAPESVSYSEGQTIKSALAGSGHTFTGLDTSGMINEIDGIGGNFTRSDENGNHDLSKDASTIQFYRFSEETNSKPSEGLQKLMLAMADYFLEDDDVKAAAKNAYDNAYGHFVGIDSESAKTLAGELTNAVKEYKDSINGTKYQVTFKNGSSLYSGAEIKLENGFGKSWSVKTGDLENGVISVPKGSYTFSVSQEGLHVKGNISVTGNMNVTAKLPTDEWLNKETFRLSQSYNGKSSDDSVIKFEDGELALTLDSWDGRKLTVPVVDKFSGTIYAYAEWFSDKLNNKRPDFTVMYQNAKSGKMMEEEQVFESYVTGAKDALKIGSDGNSLTYRITSTDTSNGYEYSQDYTVTFTRVPTLFSVQVEDVEETDQVATEKFDGNKTDYTYKVLSDVKTVVVKPSPLMSGYTVKINGEITEKPTAGVIVPLTIVDGKAVETEIKVEVSFGDFSNIYTLKIVPGEGQNVIFETFSMDVTVMVTNSNGMEIPAKVEKKPNNQYRLYKFVLVPGETYNYIATKDEYYHVTDDFTIGELVDNAVKLNLETEDWLTNLALGTKSGSNYRGNLNIEPDFLKNVHNYKTEYVDTEHNAYLWVNAINTDITVTAMYTQLFDGSIYHGKEYKIDLTSGKKDGVKLERFLMDENPIENKLTIRLSKVVDGVTHFQDYYVDFTRTLTLNNITASCDGNAATLIQKDTETSGFASDKKEYIVTVPMAANTLELSVDTYNDYNKFYNKCPDEEEIGYEVYCDGTNVTSLDKINIELDGTINTQTVTLTVKNVKAPNGSEDYKVHILKAPPVETGFFISPSDAQLAIYEVLSEERLWPNENGKYRLCEGFEYDYTLTKFGYVAKTGTLYVTRGSSNELIIQDGEVSYLVTQSGEHAGEANISWTLAAAPVNESIDTSLKAQWPNFRGNNDNHAVINVKTPISAEEGTLYWASKLGNGYDSGAVGSPIIVNNELITYASNKIFRVDTVTGQIIKTGIMAGTSSFAITSPTYAEGMVFVALSDGKIQAFDAVSLESLWIYKNPLGGQPNCPLTVHNGYLYTGFWNEEQRYANFVCVSITDEDPSNGNETKRESWYHNHLGGFYWAGAYANDDFVLVGTDDGTSSCTSQTSSMLLFDSLSGKLLDSWDGLDGDIRSTVVYDNTTNAYYFTSKGGTFYSFKVSKSSDGWEIGSTWSVKLNNGAENIKTNPPMSTCSPVVYNGRAYVGVSGTGQFNNYSGHNITVIDLNSKKIAYKAMTQGYPQTSGLLTTAYDGYAYVYFIDNATPGILRVLRDKPGQTSADYMTQEGSYTSAYALFTPTGDQAQYAICSPIVDEYGTFYFKNDSAYLMAFGSAIKKIEVTKNPYKKEYVEGDVFDPTGMVVTATYENGKTRDITSYVSYQTDKLTTDDSLFTISFNHVMYHNEESGVSMKSGVATTTPTTTLELTFVGNVIGDVNNDGMLSNEDAQMILDYEAQKPGIIIDTTVADVSGDKVVDSNDAVLILQHLSGKIDLNTIKGNTTNETEE